MDTQELMRALALSLAKDGPLPVVVYHNVDKRFKVEHANPCSNHDHFLIVVGDRDRS